MQWRKIHIPVCCRGWISLKINKKLPRLLHTTVASQSQPLSAVHTHTVSLEARRCCSSRASECFGVIRGVCGILPEGGAAWRRKSPTCLCFSDLCCPGNRWWDFPFLHFSLHYPYQPPPPPPIHAAAAAASSPTTCRIVQSHTNTHRHLLQSFHNVTGQSNCLLHYITKAERLRSAEALTPQTPVLQQHDPPRKEKTETKRERLKAGGRERKKQL